MVFLARRPSLLTSKLDGDSIDDIRTISSMVHHKCTTDDRSVTKKRKHSQSISSVLVISDTY